MKEAFKRAVALFTVGLILLTWTILTYVIGFSAGLNALYPVYSTPQKGETWQTPEY